MTDTPSYRFPREQRLKSRKIIGALFTEGISFFSYPLRISFLPAGREPGQLQVAFSAPKRRFPGAVARNQVRRRMREAWRLHCAPLREEVLLSGQSLSVMITYTGKPEDIAYARIAKAVRKAVLELKAQGSRLKDGTGELKAQS
jgi:ribonuclease P protein component